MSNENQPNKDHWRDLVESLDLDVEFDDDTPDAGGESEASEPSKEEMPQEEEASCESSPSEGLAAAKADEISEEPAPSSKVDPLFDLGWNIPEEPKESEKPTEVKAAEKTPQAELPKEPVIEKPKSELPKKPKKKPVSRGFGFGLLPDEPEEEPAEPEEEPIVADQIEETPIFEKPVEETTLEVSLDGGVKGSSIKDSDEKDDSEGASDWMALAAQLGVPIRSESELEAKEASAKEPAAAEEEPIEVEQPEVEEEYDPLAAWGAPVPAAQKPRERRPSRRKPDSREAKEAEAAQQEEPVIIGKPKDESDETKKERGRRRGRGRGRRREVESVEVIEEEEVVSTSLDVELFGDEEEGEEQPPKERRRRRRSRRSRKPTTTESADREPIEDVDVEFDTDVFDEDDEIHGAASKSHRGIPSWEEAISLVVDKNLSARSNRSDDSRSSRSRGGRGRSGRRGGGRPKE